MEVREIEPGDHERVADLTLAAYQRLDGTPLSAEYTAELRDVASRSESAIVFVAVDDDGVIQGAVTYVANPSSPYAEHHEETAASIRMLAVDPAAQGQGIGAVLTDACIARARAEGRADIVLHSATWMSAAHRLYLRAGFERDESLDWAPRPTVPLLGFRLRLPPGEGPAEPDPERSPATSPG